jgi:hypothetical protein
VDYTVNNGDLQLSRLVDTSNPKNVLREVKSIFSYHYPPRHFVEVRRCYTLIVDLFQGRFPGYRVCNTEYHDLNHTIDVFLATARLLDGYNLKKDKGISPSFAINLLNAALFHDTGYIQEDWDKEGTGAKYTMEHVERSIIFLARHSEAFRISPEAVVSISQMIACTNLSVRIDEMNFISKEEEIAGKILGTADLLGQMADRVYLEKLLFLYYEFKEAGIGGYETEYDIVIKNVDFYEMTKKRFHNELMKMYRYALYHFRERFNIDKNLYLQAINRHITYLKKIIQDDRTNFRQKLKRGSWVNTAERIERSMP